MVDPEANQIVDPPWSKLAHTRQSESALIALYWDQFAIRYNTCRVYPEYIEKRYQSTPAAYCFELALDSLKVMHPHWEN